MGLFSKAKDFLKKSVSKVVRSPIMDAIPGGSQIRSLKLGIESSKDQARYAKALAKSQPNPIPIYQQGDPMAFRGVGTTAFGGGIGGAALGGMSALPGIGGAIVRAGAGILRTTTGKISSVVLASGQKISRKKAASFIKRFGFEAGAAALGITAIEAAQLLLDDAQTPRRRRGLTYKQIQSARRTACMVSKMARDLNVKPAPRRTGTCR